MDIPGDPWFWDYSTAELHVIATELAAMNAALTARLIRVFADMTAIGHRISQYPIEPDYMEAIVSGLEEITLLLDEQEEHFDEWMANMEEIMELMDEMNQRLGIH